MVSQSDSVFQFSSLHTCRLITSFWWIDFVVSNTNAVSMEEPCACSTEYIYSARCTSGNSGIAFIIIPSIIIIMYVSL